MQHFSALGQTTTAPTKQIETFEAPHGVEQVKLECSELTAFCPVTQQPDYYKLEITYIPQGVCLETKSLKLYLWSFRDERAFAEALAARIAEDLQQALNAEYLSVLLEQQVRGGIVLKALAVKHCNQHATTQAEVKQ